MIESIKLKFGATSTDSPLEIKPTPLTIFIGPNNSGKSALLREIYQYCRDGRDKESDLILNSAEFKPANYETALSELETPPPKGTTIQKGHLYIGSGRSNMSVSEVDFKNHITARQKNHYCQYYLNFQTLMLDGVNRLTLINPKARGDLLESPKNSFQSLWVDEEKLQLVEKIIYDALGKYFVLDPSYQADLRARLSSQESPLEDKYSLNPAALKFYAVSSLITDLSDGMKAFCGIITEVIAGSPKVLTLDEPEAFLHPSLAYKLGKDLAASTVGEDKKIFISTHSSHFLMGCVQSGVKVNIVRLTYQNDVATAQLLDQDSLASIMTDPLIRSTGILEGLFYENVIVTEADADRAFYQEINERLLASNSPKGIKNCLFVNGQGKSSIPKLLTPLRALSVPSAAILDIDAIKDGGAVWQNLTSSAKIPEAIRNSAGHLRQEIKSKFNTSGKDMKKDGGISILSKTDKEVANSLFKQLGEYGLFVVPHGEVESWLKSLDVSRNKHTWLQTIFEKMGNDPSNSNYIKPSDGDVWDFIGEINDYFSAPR